MTGAPVLVAPDKFKGTFTAAEVAASLAAGLRRAGAGAEELPVADGGEGTLEALLGAAGGEVRTAPAHDPLGRVIEARFALLGDGTTAVVEAAEASGLRRMAPEELDPWNATTLGTGELIAAAAAAGAEEVIVGAGGTATVDGGAGALRALEEAEVLPGRIVVACDARSAWESAAPAFGPQKGADAETTKRLAARLDRLAPQLPKDPRGVPFTGCGGGLSGALWSVLGAGLVAGAPLVLDAIGFDAAMRGARFVVTGEAASTSRRSRAKPPARWPRAAASLASAAMRWWARRGWSSSRSASSTSRA